MNSLLDDFVAFGLGESLQLEGLVSQEGHCQVEIVIPELGERKEIQMGGEKKEKQQQAQKKLPSPKCTAPSMRMATTVSYNGI